MEIGDKVVIKKRGDCVKMPRLNPKFIKGESSFGQEATVRWIDEDGDFGVRENRFTYSPAWMGGGDR